MNVLTSKTLIFAFVLSSPAHTALAQTKAPPTTFFVTSVGPKDGGGNLGGLEGADAHCRDLAKDAGLPEGEWRAYLSAAPRGQTPGVDARDRIGKGPWHNATGALVARNIDELHSDRSRVDRRLALTEKGEAIPGNRHDILTGSNEDGRLAFAYGEPATCSNWTSDLDGRAMMGHSDRFMDRGARFPFWNRSWVASHPSRGCDAARIKQTGSAGLFYCFSATRRAVQPEAASQPVREGFVPTFRRGLNVAHWLSHNYLPAAPYGASWFDEEDVSWIAAQGFDHLRLRIAGDRIINKNGDIDEAGIEPIDRALAWAKRHKLGVVLTMFSLPGFRHRVIGEPAPADTSSPFTDPDTFQSAAYVWWQVARRYADEGRHLRFELLHRPQAPDAGRMRAFNEALLKAIRATNPTRVVYVTSHDMDARTLGETMDSDLIAADWNVALAFENHDFDVFTAQHDAARPLVAFPGRVPDMGQMVSAEDPVRKDFGRELTVADVEARFAEFARSIRPLAWGREVYLAEFGVYERADDRSAEAYLRAVRGAVEREGWSWAVYDYQSGCAVRGNNGTGSPTRNLAALDLKTNPKPPNP